MITVRLLPRSEPIELHRRSWISSRLFLDGNKLIGRSYKF